MNKLKYTYLLLFAIAIIFPSCEKEDPEIPNEEELITTLTYTLLSEDGTETVEFTFVDLDGDGGDAPQITGGTLKSNTVYSGTITLLNEIEEPTEDITIEVEEEAAEHQFFYQSSISDVTIAYADQDDDGNPVGLQTTLTSGEVGSGTITITLRHEPNKTAEGVSDGELSNAGGETDIEVTFPINVE